MHHRVSGQFLDGGRREGGENAVNDPEISFYLTIQASYCLPERRNVAVALHYDRETLLTGRHCCDYSRIEPVARQGHSRRRGRRH